MNVTRIWFASIAAIGLLAMPAVAAEPEDTQAIRALVQQWVDAADQQDADLAERILHTQSVQFVPHTKAPGGALTITRDQYLEGIRAKKIGGSSRKVQIQSVELDRRARNAVVKVEIESETMIFYQFIGLSKLAAKDWKIVSVLSDILSRP